jgi:hypothetical protein
MALPKRAKAKARGRISPTEALTIMRTRMAAPLGAKLLTEAMHDWKRRCRLWRDRKLATRAEVEHLYVRDVAYDAGEWHAVIGDDRHNAVSAEYEFDAEEVWRLLEAPASPSAKLPAPAPTPRRRKPGKKIKHNWRLHAAVYVHDFRAKEGRTPTSSEIAQHCEEELGYQPDVSDIAKLLRYLLDE